MSEPRRAVREVDAAQGHGDDLGARGVDGTLGLGDVLVLAGADDQAAVEAAAGDDEGIGVLHGGRRRA